MLEIIKKYYGYFYPYNSVKTRVIQQLSETECGVASLAMIFAYYDFNISLEELRENCGASRDGCKATTLINVARSYGFAADAYKIDINTIYALAQPVIAYWNFSHYVVIKGAGHNKVFINDPALGAITVSLEEFDKAFTGVVISIIPTEKSPKLKRASLLASMFTDWWSSYQLELIFLLLAMSIIVFSPLLNSALSGIFIDQCVVANNRSWLPYITCLSLLSTFIYTGSTVVQRWNQFKINTKVSFIKLSSIINHTLQLPLIFYSLRQKSEIISILARAELVVSLYLKSITSATTSIILVIICLIFMFCVDSAMALITIAISIISLVSISILTKLNFNHEIANLTSHGKLYSHSIAMVRNIDTIKSCGLEENILKRWHKLFCRRLIINDKKMTITTVINSVNKTYHSISIVFIFCFGGIRIAQGAISVGNLMAYYSIHLYLANILAGLIQALKDSQNALAAQMRINDITSYQPDSRFTTQNTHLINTHNDDVVLSAKHVAFYYNKTTAPTLFDIFCDIRGNEHIALVGGTGSGKSTLAKLLCALYQASAGEIKLFGNPISHYSADQLTKYFSYISQDVSLFAGTIYDNITLWNPSTPITTINQAIQAACLEELIEQRGLHGNVDEHGSNFSGGEKQRIDIARAFVQNTPIIILDEATSALDVATEAKLINNLRKLPKTVIFVAHRLSTIQHCDQIMVLEQGRVVERGDHQQLMKNKNNYFNLILNEEANPRKIG